MVIYFQKLNLKIIDDNLYHIICSPIFTKKLNGGQIQLAW